MSNSPLKLQLEAEIEALREEINDEFRNCHELCNPKVVALSQILDKKIIKYQELTHGGHHDRDIQQAIKMS